MSGHSGFPAVCFRICLFSGIFRGLAVYVDVLQSGAGQSFRQRAVSYLHLAASSLRGVLCQDSQSASARAASLWGGSPGLEWRCAVRAGPAPRPCCPACSARSGPFCRPWAPGCGCRGSWMTLRGAFLSRQRYWVRLSVTSHDSGPAGEAEARVRGAAVTSPRSVGGQRPAGPAGSSVGEWQVRSLGRVPGCSLFHSAFPSLWTCRPLGRSHTGLWTLFHLSIGHYWPCSFDRICPRAVRWAVGSIEMSQLLGRPVQRFLRSLSEAEGALSSNGGVTEGSREQRALCIHRGGAAGGWSSPRQPPLFSAQTQAPATFAGRPWLQTGLLEALRPSQTLT